MKASPMKVPLARPEISEADIAAVVDVLRSTYLSQGPAMRAFEEALAAYLNVTHTVAVNSGTSGLQLALRALEIRDGDEVILPSFSFMAVTNAVLSERAVPVYVDIAPGTLNMAPDALESAITKRTRAVIVVHSFGFPAQARTIVEFARRRNLAVIEDACEALGAEYQADKAGSLADVGIFAFYPNKLITTGEGGALVTNSAALASRLESLRNQGRRSGNDWWQHGEPGFSCRLSDINCALGRQQLSRIEQILCRREELAATYRLRLKANANLSCFGADPADMRISWFTYPVLLNESFTREDRDEVWAEMRRRGIECGRYFAPSHLQPSLRGAPFRCCDLTETMSVSSRLLCLPMFHSLSEAQIEYVCTTLDGILRNRTFCGAAAHAAVSS